MTLSLLSSYGIFSETLVFSDPDSSLMKPENRPQIPCFSVQSSSLSSHTAPAGAGFLQSRQKCAKSLEKQHMPFKHSIWNLEFHKLFRKKWLSRSAHSFQSHVCLLKNGLDIQFLNFFQRSTQKKWTPDWEWELGLLLFLSATEINNLEKFIVSLNVHSLMPTSYRLLVVYRGHWFWVNYFVSLKLSFSC